MMIGLICGIVITFRRRGLFLGLDYIIDNIGGDVYKWKLRGMPTRVARRKPGDHPEFAPLTERVMAPKQGLANA
jgi:hypothetical protein